MSATVGLGIAITLADMFTPKLAKAEKRFGRFAAKLSAVSTASVALGNKLSAKIGSYYETFADVAQKQGDLMSLGLSERAIRIVDAAAMEFTNRYSGYTRAAFEAAAYDIKSGISSLTDEGLKQMTTYSLLTAKATKASGDTMSKAFALGYGIFRDEFGSDMEFGQKFSATFSAAVQQFRTDGDDLARGMSNVGAMAKSMGVSLAQEYAIIGTAKDAFDSASEAGTSYKAFLMGALNAQKKLGMRFTDANGKMLPMVEILEKIRRKFGDLDANEIGLLKKYFGSDEAVKIITALIQKTDKLREAEAKLKAAQEKGIGYTEQMAQARNYGQEMVLLRQQGENLAYMFGKALAPSVGWLAKKFARLVRLGQQWMSRHGELATRIATGVTAFAALATVLGTVGVGVAAISFGMGTLGISMSGILAIGAPIVAIFGAMAAAGIVIYKHWGKVTKIWSALKDGFTAGYRQVVRNLPDMSKKFAPLIRAFDWAKSGIRGLLWWLERLIGRGDNLQRMFEHGRSAGRFFGEMVAGVTDILAASVRGWEKIFKWGIHIFRNLFSWVPDGTLAAAWGGVKDIVKMSVEGWAALVKTGMGIIRGEIAFDPSTVLSGAWEGAKWVFEASTRGWKRIISGVWTEIKEILSWDPLTVLSGLWDRALNWLNEKISAIKEKFQTFIDWAKSLNPFADKSDAGVKRGKTTGSSNGGGSWGPSASTTTFPTVTTPVQRQASTEPKNITIHEGDIHVSVTGVTDPKQVADMVMRRLAAHQRDKRDRSVLS